jgi:hypothetical protein
MATRYASITGGVGVPRTFIGGVTGGAGIAESNGLRRGDSLFFWE